MASGRPNKDGDLKTRSDLDVFASPIVEQHSSSAETQGHSQRSLAKSIVLVATMSLAMIINGTAFSVALPTIQKELDVQEANLQWVISAYPLSSGCLLLLCGRLADLYGRKRMFVIGSIVFLVFTIGCAVTKVMINVIVLNVLRGLQGIGTAAQIPASLGILANEFPSSKARSLAFAAFSAGAPIGAVFGFVVGGIMTEFTKQTWRSILYFLSGLTAICLVGGFFAVDCDKSTEKKDEFVDWIGAFLVTTGLVQITFVLSQGELAPQKWATPYLITILILGVFFIFLFLFWLHYLESVQSKPSSRYTIFNPPPLFKFSIWTRANGRLAATFVVSFADYCAFVSWLNWVQLYFQNYQKYSPVGTVIRLLPAFLSSLLCNAFFGLMAARIPIVWIITIGTPGTSTASLLFATVIPDVTYWVFCFPAICIGVFGADFVFAAGSLFIAKYAHPDEQSVASALFNTVIQLGTVFGVTVTTAVYNSVAESAISERRDPIVLYRAAQYTSFGFGIFATVIAVIAFRGVGAIGAQEQRAITVQIELDDILTEQGEEVVERKAAGVC